MGIMIFEDLIPLRQWIGRTERREGVVTAELVARMKATIHQIEMPADVVPLGLHWCLALDAPSGSHLGVDGHADKGGFLPPVPLPNRMWASGEIEFLGRLIVGDTVQRRSEVTDIYLKNGRSGPLCFVTVAHQWSTIRGLAISERQHIVYRNARVGEVKEAPLPSVCPVAKPSAPDSIAVLPDAAMLFRYSALTFNAHRIHYDLAYAVGVEGYPERVVQGPLQATLLLNLAAAVAGPPSHFSFRAVRPAFAGETLWLTKLQAGLGIALQTENVTGQACLQATADWKASDAAGQPIGPDDMTFVGEGRAPANGRSAETDRK